MTNLEGPKQDLERVAHALLDTTRASRVTFRVQLPPLDFDTAFVEALNAGVNTLGTYRPSYRGEPAIREYLRRHRSILVQDEVIGADPAPPPALVEIHKVRAQMVGPIFDGDDLIGVLAVHQVDAPRVWSRSDLVAFEDAMAKVATIVESMRTLPR
jgi:GAF domain-containing protein